jgi:hypothetical protein
MAQQIDAGDEYIDVEHYPDGFRPDPEKSWHWPGSSKSEVKP